jgi:hypothetical protein
MPRTTRRQFARTLTAAGAAALVATDLTAQEKEKEPPPNALGLALAGVTRAQFGQFLSEEEMTRVGSDFQQYAPFIEGFRKFPLKNADEPDFTFHSLTDRW